MNNKSFEVSTFAMTVLSLAYCLATPHAISQSVSKQPIETEAQRLQTVRTLVGQEKSRRLQPASNDKPKSTAAFCEAMLDDLLNNKGFKAIEPVAVLDFEYPVWDIALAEAERRERKRIAAKQLGPILTKSLRRCAHDGRGDAVKFFGFHAVAGAPPYLAYVLPNSVNPFPESKLVYWSEYLEKLGTGRKGYSWVNLDICEHTNGTSSLSDSLQLRDDPKGQVAALTLYQGKLVSWEVSRNRAFVADHFEPKYETPMKSRIICHWATFPEVPVRK